MIAGTHRGRRLRGPQGSALRPTSDRVREALFSILGNRVSGSRFLDLYAGTGAVGIEALSRGAAQVTCVESHSQALALLRRNVLDCGMTDRMIVQGMTVKQFVSRPDRWNGPYDLVFADPPYAEVGELASLLNDVDRRIFAPNARLVVEHAAKTPLPASVGDCVFSRRYTYGDTALSLYIRANSTPS